MNIQKKKIFTAFNRTIRTGDLARFLGKDAAIGGILDWIKNYSNVPISDHYLPGKYWVRNYTISTKFWPLGLPYYRKSRLRIKNSFLLEKQGYVLLRIQYWVRVVKS